MAEEKQYEFNYAILEDLIVIGLLMPYLGDGLTINIASIVKIETISNRESQNVLRLTSIGGVVTHLTIEQSQELEKKIAQILTIASGAAPKQSGRIVVPNKRPI